MDKLETNVEKQLSLTNSSGDFHKVIAEPSHVIKHTEQIVHISDVSVCLTLVAMNRSFLLVISNPSTLQQHDDCTDRMAGFKQSNLTLKGLSLAIGEHNTCLISSDSSLASATLASRLSKKFNNNRPVYVANNLQPARDMIDSDGFVSKLYLKIFQFIRSNYVVVEKTDTINK